MQVPTVDQRGALRGPRGLNAGSRPDIGAYEASSSYLVSTNTDIHRRGTLRTGVSWANISTNANLDESRRSRPEHDCLRQHRALRESTDDHADGGPALADRQWQCARSASRSRAPAPAILTISGNNTGSVFSVGLGVTASISGLTITGGLATNLGGGIDNSGALTLSNLARDEQLSRLGAAVSPTSRPAR